MVTEVGAALAAEKHKPKGKTITVNTPDGPQKVEVGLQHKADCSHLEDAKYACDCGAVEPPIT